MRKLITHETNELIDIKYYTLFEKIESSTPVDTSDKYTVIDNFVDELPAEILRKEKDSELLAKIRNNPTFTNTHTSYFVRENYLRLRK